MFKKLTLVGLLLTIILVIGSAVLLPFAVRDSVEKGADWMELFYQSAESYPTQDYAQDSKILIDVAHVNLSIISEANIDKPWVTAEGWGRKNIKVDYTLEDKIFKIKVSLEDKDQVPTTKEFELLERLSNLSDAYHVQIHIPKGVEYQITGTPGYIYDELQNEKEYAEEVKASVLQAKYLRYRCEICADNGEGFCEAGTCPECQGNYCLNTVKICSNCEGIFEVGVNEQICQICGELLQIVTREQGGVWTEESSTVAEERTTQTEEMPPVALIAVTKSMISRTISK